jgi:dTMP kinase
MKGLFITFEGTEGSGKSAQMRLLAEALKGLDRIVRVLREPGSTPIGEEIRHTLKHSQHNHAMTPEAELLLMIAARAQLVREVIRPALAAGHLVLCDRFSDSTLAYQGYGRQLDRSVVEQLITFAVGDTRPDLTLLLTIPLAVSEARRSSRQVSLFKGLSESAAELPRLGFTEPLRDRMEEADRGFFERVERGYEAIAAAEPDRVRVIDATPRVEAVQAAVWREVERLLAQNK